MTDLPILAQKCFVRPPYRLLSEAYQYYRTDREPCKLSHITDQCAVRMSVALERSGVSLNAFPDQSRVHQARGRRTPDPRRCDLNIPHVPGAEELAVYLKRILPGCQEFRGASLSQARPRISGRRGIVYFNNCFQRRGQTGRRGDHIDLWTGNEYFNQVLNAPPGRGASADAALFETADKIWFFETPG